MVAQPSRSIALNDQVAAADHPGCVRRRSQISHWSSTGQLSGGVDLSPWHQDEPALVGVRMGQLEIILITLAGADHDDVRGIAERVDRSLQVTQAVTEIGAEGVDDLAQRFHAAKGVGIDRVGIRAAHLTYSLST